MIKRNRLIASTLAVLAIVSSGYGIEANAATTDTASTTSNVQIYSGWEKASIADGSIVYHYYENGARLTGEHKIGNKYYIFGDDGSMLVNVWALMGKVTTDVNARNSDFAFFYGKDGARESGGVVVAGENGWIRGIDGAHRATWYFYENGNKVTGEKFIDGKHYFFDKEGAFTTDAWVVNGVLTNNFEPQFKNSTHYYDCNGMQARGWCKMEKSYVNGRGDWMYFDENGIQQKGWVISNHNSYYMDIESGYLKTGWLKLDDTWFHFDKNGKEQVGWVSDNCSWYYMNRNGVMQTGWQKVDGKWYFLNSNGAMKTGWVKSAGSWFYLANNGAMKTGWVKDEANWYFLYGNGIMAENCMIGSYHVNASGVWDN